MQNEYQFNIINPNFSNLGYVVAIANIKDKHDRSAPSHYHWKVLKCRIIIFTKSTILACPDKMDIKQVHIIFNKMGDDYDKLNSLFMKFSLKQEGAIRNTTPEIFEMCFRYTMLAKIAPVWNILGEHYLINNRDFLISSGPQEGIKYHISCCDDNNTVMKLKPVKISLIRADEEFLPGEWIRVLPSLNKAIVEESCESLSEIGNFKSYTDLRRHWKNIHGYRLPKEECSYYMIRFWRGDPLTYPKICTTKNFPIIVPMTKSADEIVLSRFLNYLKYKMSHIAGMTLTIQQINSHGDTREVDERLSETQAVSLCARTQLPISLCTPTQPPPSV